MARTVGAQTITGWREHGLLRGLALNKEASETLAEKYGLAVQTVYDWRHKKKHRINAVLDEWANEVSDIWAVKKHARIADLRYMVDSIQERMDELVADADGGGLQCVAAGSAEVAFAGAAYSAAVDS